MKIKKVKLIADGGNGVKITYVKKEEKAGKEWNVFIDSEHTYPATTALKEGFDKLKIHVLKLCRLWDGDQDEFITKAWDLVVPNEAMPNGYVRMQSLISDMKIVGVTSDLESFVLIGKIKGIDNGNVNLISMNIGPETEYVYYDEVIDIIGNIYQDTAAYIEEELEYEELTAKLPEAKKAIMGGEAPVPMTNEPTAEEVEKQNEEILARTGKVVDMKPAEEADIEAENFDQESLQNGTD